MRAPERRSAFQLRRFFSPWPPPCSAYALTDSPAGLAAWIIEKFRAWSDCAGDVDAYFGRDVLLTNVMIY